MGKDKIVVLGKFSEIKGKRWELSRWERWVGKWEDRLKEMRALPLMARTAAVFALLMEVEEVLIASASADIASPAYQRVEPILFDSQTAVAAFAPNDANPAKQGVFDGDGHILLNLVLYGAAGFVISLILRYMGRGELSMIVLMITGFVVLRQVLYVLKELMSDVKTLLNM